MTKVRKAFSGATLPLLLVTALFAAVLAGHGVALAETDESDPSESIVYLEGGATVADMWVPYGSQTACVVGEEGEDPSYLVTDDHLIDTFEYYGSGKHASVSMGKDKDSVTGYVVLRVYRPGQKYMEAYLVEHDTKNGLVLLRCENPLKDVTAIKVRELDETNDLDASVRVVGYPGFLDESVETMGTSAGFIEPYVQSGHVSKIGTLDASGVRVLWTDAKVVSGSTGGPIIDDDGVLVGINTWGDDGKDNYGIQSAEIKELLDRNKVAFTETSASSSKDDEAEDEADEESEEAETDTAADESTEDEGSSDETTDEGTGDTGSMLSVESGVPLPVVILVVLVVVAAVVGLVLFPRLRNKK